eukprot:CAMPEP_0175144564 /NCGR_PEP_ID=MMETSP0087-20121206/14217_1 /TAXON_ID=136419 /ORGANISM="Unknown Unknown, Strain D1" /LENGTH=857 /DNA_ID=CAMNT_0016429077 /DNA_START=20 /DNA_END=2593 /DNA_ORIENTATION=-
MRLFCFCMLVAVAISSTDGTSQTSTMVPPSPEVPLLGFHQLFFPESVSADGRKATQNFVHDHDMGTTLLKYAVEKADNVDFIHLGEDPSVVAVDCSKLCAETEEGKSGELHLKMRSPVDAEKLLAKASSRPVVVTGTLRWGCLDHNGLPIHIQHKATQLPSLLDGSTDVVQLKVARADYHEVFKNADIHFVTEKFDGDQFMGHHVNSEAREPRPFKSEARKLREKSHSNDPSTNHKQLRGWFSGFLKSVWNVAKSLGSLVQKAVNVVKTGIEVLVTGDYDMQKTLYSNTWVYNIDPSTNKIVDGNIKIDTAMSCSNCGARATFAVEFKLKISDYSLSLMRMVAKGSFNAVAGAALRFGASYSQENSKTVYTVKLKPITFVLFGIPIVLNIEIPIDIGYQLDVDANAIADCAMQANGNFQYGAAYTRSAGLHLISESDFDYSGGLNQINGALSMSMTVYVLPVVTININYLGNVNIGLKPFLETTVALSSQYTDPCYRNLALACNLGLTVTAGAEIDISLAGKSLYKKELFSETVLNVKKPILAGCYLLQSENNSSNLILNHTEELERVLRPFPPLLSTVAGTAEELQQKKEFFASRPFLDAPELLFRGDGALFSSSSNSSSLQLKKALDTTKLGALDDSGCSIGTSWNGVTVRGTGSSSSCSQYPSYREQSFQAHTTTVTGSGPIIDMIGSVNDAVSDSPDNRTYACVYQQGWSASIYQGGGLLFTQDSSVEPYLYCSDDSAQCSCNAPGTLLPNYMYGSTTADFSSITLEDTLLCTKTVLTRVKPGTTGAYYSNLKLRGLLKQGSNCGMSPTTPTPAAPGSCCGGMPAQQCNLPSGSSCSFGCQCQSGACPTYTCS